MKILNDEGLTPSEEAARDALLTMNDKTAGWKRARSARRVKIKPSKKPAKTGANELTAAVEILIERLGTPRGHPDFARKVRAEVAEINSGNWNPVYWKKNEDFSTDFLTNVPTGVIDPNPPPYGYRVAGMQPSIPTYGEGTASGAAAFYEGALVGNTFFDLTYTWSKTTFVLDAPIKANEYEPVLMVFNGQLTSSGTTRGSRPMLSMVTRSFLCGAAGAALLDKSAPIVPANPALAGLQRGARSEYWRYDIPVAAAPFFNQVNFRRVLQDLNKSASIDTGYPLEFAVVLVAPRPMFGRGFNNNSHVLSTLTGTPEIYQLPRVPGPMQLNPNQTYPQSDSYTFTSKRNGYSVATEVSITTTTTGGRTTRRVVCKMSLYHYQMTIQDSEFSWGSYWWDAPHHKGIFINVYGGPFVFRHATTEELAERPSRKLCLEYWDFKYDYAGFDVPASIMAMATRHLIWNTGEKQDFPPVLRGCMPPIDWIYVNHANINSTS